MKTISVLSFGDDLIVAKVGNEYLELLPNKDFIFRDYTFEEAVDLMFYNLTKEEQAYIFLNTEIISERS